MKALFVIIVLKIQFILLVFYTKTLGHILFSLLNWL